MRVENMDLISKRLFFEKATGAAAINVDFVCPANLRIKSVRVKLSAAGAAGSFDISVDANAGAAYDQSLFTKDFTSVVNENLVDCNWDLEEGDILKVDWVNGSSRTYGLVITYHYI